MAGGTGHASVLSNGVTFNLTYIEVKGKWKYLYRAVDSKGNTLDFMLSAKRDAGAAERFFRKALKAGHNQTPRVINVDKNAAYPKAIDELKADQTLTESSELRPIKYLNNIVKQDHRFIKRLVNTGMGFGSFNTARRTLRGYEAMNMVRKGQIQGVEKGDILGDNMQSPPLAHCAVAASHLRFDWRSVSLIFGVPA